VPALVRNITGFGRGTVLEGINPGVLLPPPKRLRQKGNGCNPLYWASHIGVAILKESYE